MPTNGWLLPQEYMPQPPNAFQVSAFADEMQERKFRNRLLAITVKEKEEEQKKNKLMSDFMMSQMGQQGQLQQGQAPQQQPLQMQRPPQQPMMQAPQLPQGPQQNPMMQRPQGLPPMNGQPQQAPQQRQPPSPWDSQQFQKWMQDDPVAAITYKKSIIDPDLPDKPTKEQLYTIATTDPNPVRAKKARAVLKAQQADDMKNVTDFATFYRGYKAEHPQATELDISNAWHKIKIEENKQQLANRIISFSDLAPNAQKMIDKLADQVHQGNMDPKNAENALRAFGTNAQGAFAERYTDKYGGFDQVRLQANADFYKNPANQRLIRQIQSTFEAMDEDKRLAQLVNNPAGTPLNKLKGAAQVAFGNSQRAMFNMGNLASIDEFNRIMGGNGGAVQYFEELKKKIDPNMSVKQYLDVMNEAKYYLATRLKAYTEGTPLEKKIGPWYEQVKESRPYLSPEKKGGTKKLTFNPATGELE
jgi:hypothetical protein